jgi:hypothetical protein
MALWGTWKTGWSAAAGGDGVDRACNVLRLPMAWFHLHTDRLHAHVQSTRSLDEPSEPRQRTWLVRHSTQMLYMIGTSLASAHSYKNKNLAVHDPNHKLIGTKNVQSRVQCALYVELSKHGRLPSLDNIHARTRDLPSPPSNTIKTLNPLQPEINSQTTTGQDSHQTQTPASLPLLSPYNLLYKTTRAYAQESQ